MKILAVNSSHTLINQPHTWHIRRDNWQLQRQTNTDANSSSTASSKTVEVCIHNNSVYPCCCPLDSVYIVLCRPIAFNLCHELRKFKQRNLNKLHGRRISWIESRLLAVTLMVDIIILHQTTSSACLFVRTRSVM